VASGVVDCDEVLDRFDVLDGFDREPVVLLFELGVDP
jgi:hypothetical protein